MAAVQMKALEQLEHYTLNPLLRHQDRQVYFWEILPGQVDGSINPSNTKGSLSN